MTILIAIFVGSWVGFFLSLIPGLSLAIALGAIMASGLQHAIGNLETGCFVAAAAGTALYSRNLSFVLNPNALGGNVEALDPALRMAAAGKAGLALRLMTYGTDLSWGIIGMFALVLVGGSLMGANLAKYLDVLIGPLGVPLILWWVWYVCKESKKPAITACGFVLTGTFGYAVLHAPALSGSANQLAPILAGLFGVPIALASFFAPVALNADGSIKMSVTLEAPGDPVVTEPVLAVLGSAMGCMTGFFAGLGSGSLVAMAQSLTNSDEDYVLMSSAGSSSNDVIALILIVAAGMGRSGEAILLGRVVPQPASSMTILLIALAIIYGISRGRKWTHQTAERYAKCVSMVPRTWSTVFIILLSLVPVTLAGGPTILGQLSSWGLLACGVMLSFWCRLNFLPNQVAFGSLALPLVVSALGLVPFANNLLF